MINRRTLLLGTASAALSSLLVSCQQASVSALKVVLLEGTIPAEVLQKFKKEDESPVVFQAKTQIADIFQQLQLWKKADEERIGDSEASNGFWDSAKRWLPWTKDVEQGPSDRLVSLGDYWLESAIAQNLIEPLDIPADSLEKLPATWQQLGRRDQKGRVEGLSATTQAGRAQTDSQVAAETEPQKISLWAAPYKVQTLVVVYRQSFFPQAAGKGLFNSWQDLLLPDLKQSITLPDHPRLVLALAQKIQTGRFNAVLEGSGATDDVVRVPSTEDSSAPSAESSTADRTLLTAGVDSDLVKAFTRLDQQVKTYNSQNPLKALVNEDVKAVVCWSGDAIAALNRYRDLRVAIPEEGSLLSADMWVRPKGAALSEAAQRWIDFCWQIGPATQISVSNEGISPIFLDSAAVRPDAIAGGQLSASVMQNSELLLPIPATLKTAYVELWKQLRSSQANT